MFDTTCLTQTWRSLLRSPGTTLVAIVILAVAIGAGTSIFSLLYGALLRPIPYPQAERLIRVHNVFLETGGSGPFSTPNYLDLVQQNRTLDELVGYSVQSLNLATEAAPERVRALAVTANFFDGLGVRPALGRGFETGEDRRSAVRVAVISWRLWRERFQGLPGALGETMRLNGEIYTVVGVLPASFWFPGDPRLVVPFAWDDSDLADDNRGSRWLFAFGRLRRGVGLRAARDDLAGLTARIAEQYPDNNEGWTIDTVPFREFAVGSSRDSLLALTGAVVLVLLIGCVNVANLMLVRAERRQHEMAVRAALGAGRGRLTAGFLAEGLMLSTSGAVAGLGLADLGVRLALRLAGDALPRSESIGLGSLVFLFALGLAVLTGLVVGLVPALRLDMGRLQESLRGGGRGAAGGSSWLQKVFVAAEVAIAVVLVTGAGLLVHSFLRLNAIDTGIQPDRAMVFQLDLPAATYGETFRAAGFTKRALNGIADLPGVEYVGVSQRIPLMGGLNMTSLPAPDDPEIVASFVEIREVTPDFFPAAGIPLLRGRSFTPADAESGREVVIISDVLADTIFPGESPLGQRILRDWNDLGWEVVGVVGSVREFGVTGEPRPAVYWPYPSDIVDGKELVFIARTTGADPLHQLPEIRRVITALDPNLPLYGVRSLRDVVVETSGNRQLATWLFVVFGTLALGLASLGIFGVLAYLVEQRTREIGIRMALGATRVGVTRLVVAEVLKLLGAGLVAGVGIALVVSRLLVDLLFEVESTDPLTLTAVVVVALAAAGLAASLPARRAARLQPMVALRSE